MYSGMMNERVNEQNDIINLNIINNKLILTLIIFSSVEYYEL